MAESGASSSRNMVLRTIYIDPRLDDWLKQQAFSSSTSKNDLLRQYLEKGIVAEAEADVKSPRKYADVLRIMQDMSAQRVLEILQAKISPSANKKAKSDSPSAKSTVSSAVGATFGSGMRSFGVRKATKKRAVAKAVKKAPKKAAVKKAR